MRIPAGVTDQYIYFVAVDATDLKTRETGLSGFTVYRSRNGGAAASMTTPTVNETDSSNMPGVYELLLDEDMTIDAGDDSQEMIFHITTSGMAPVSRVIELYRPKISVGYTLSVEADGDLTKVNTLDGHTAQTGDSYPRIGTAGAGLTDLGGMSTAMKAEINAEADTALTDYDPPTKTEMDLNATQIVALVTSDVSDEFTVIKGATFSAATDTLEAIRDRGDVAWLTGAGGSAPTVGEIADAVWDEATSGHTGGGTFGEQCKTDIDAILADTNELQSDDVPTLIGALNDVSSADVNAACDTALTDYDAPTKAELDAGLAALNDLSAADVNAELVDVLKTDTIADRSAGLPPATPTFEQAISYLYGSMRNSIDIDAGFKEFYNNAGALIWKKALSDDGDNYVEAKAVAP